MELVIFNPLPSRTQLLFRFFFSFSINPSVLPSVRISLHLPCSLRFELIFQSISLILLIYLNHSICPYICLSNSVFLYIGLSIANQSACLLPQLSFSLKHQILFSLIIFQLSRYLSIYLSIYLYNICPLSIYQSI